MCVSEDDDMAGFEGVYDGDDDDDDDEECNAVFGGEEVCVL